MANSFNRHDVSTFFTNLEQVLQRCPAFADRISTLNVPEKSPRVLTQRRIKKVRQATIGERGVLVISCCIFSASNSISPSAFQVTRDK
jgi:hypothetical protein